MRPRVLTLLLGLFLCSTTLWAAKTDVGYDRSVDFSSYKTYSWVKPAREPVHPILYYSILGAIDEELQAKGLKKVEEGGDLLIVLEGGVGVTGANTWSGGPILPTYSTPPSTNATMWVGMTVAAAGSTVLEGQLGVNLVDGAANRMVWRGVVKEKFNVDTKKKKALELVNKAISQLFERFPPKKKP